MYAIRSYYGLRVLELAPGAAVNQFGAIGLAGKLITPILEGTFGELHDIALVHQGHGVTIVVDGILDGGTDQTLGPCLGHGLDADAVITADETNKSATHKTNERFSKDIVILLSSK